MSVTLGFPIVLDKKAGTVDAVWISTRPAAGNGTVYWNGVPLTDADMFGNDHVDLDQAITRIVRNRDLLFKCPKLPTIVPGKIIGGRSYGLAIKLIEHFDAGDGDVKVLLSGRTDAKTGTKPLSLEDTEGTRLKGRHARNTSSLLLLLQKDYSSLGGEEFGSFHAADESAAILPHAVEDIQQWTEEHQCGRAYVLPIAETGLWRDTNLNWWQGLGRLLNLLSTDGARPATTVSKATAPTPVPQLPTAAAPVATPCKPKPGTVGELYATALPSNQEYLSRFLSYHPELSTYQLFAQGVAEQAIKRKDELFLNRLEGVSPDQHILVGGPTGCGKTFLGEAILLNEVMEMDSHAIYIAPTRSLAFERWSELCARLIIPGTSDFTTDNIILSSGEVFSDDWRLQLNRFKIAVLVNEKANLFLRPTGDFLQRLGLIVIDELHMLADPSRGGVLDMLLAKVHRENDRRIRRIQLGEMVRPLRVVGITTEGTVRNPSITSAFNISSNYSRIEPVIISADERPEEVEHVACVYQSQDAHDRREVSITTFRSQNDRLLALSRCAAIANSIITTIKTMESSRNRRPVQAGSKQQKLNTALREVILNYARDYKTVMVSHPSIPGLKEIASQIKNYRKKQGYPPISDPDLVKRVQEWGVSKSVGETLLELSEYGLYLHHSELPKTIKDVIQDRFRGKSEGPNGLSQILFTTETLFYGVNLTIECLLLTSTRWTRDIPGEEDLGPRDLTPNEFHNIFGRVGRPGKCDSATVPKAIVCFASGDYADKLDGVNTLIRTYYSQPVVSKFAPPVLSGLFTPTDFSDLAKGTLTSLEKVSYPSFRSTMDALRHLGGVNRKYVEIVDIVALVDPTVFVHSCQLSRDDLTRLIERVLELSKHAGLVEADEDKKSYRITARAEALIDTGTKYESVGPMERWLELLQELSTTLSIRPIPVELLLPAFVSSRDLWMTSRTFGWESSETNSDKKRKAELEVHSLLLDELKVLGLSTTDAEVVEKALAKLVHELATGLPVTRGTPSEYRRAIFYRVVVALLRWLRGRDTDEIAILSIEDLNPKFLKEAKQFKERYCERAGWLSTMCLRYFDKTDKFLPEHRRELPRLGQRLRQGVRSLGVPLISQARSQLSRREVHLLLDAGMTPARIVGAPHPAADIAALALTGGTIRATALVDDVYAFYRNQLLSLCDALNKDLDNTASDDGWEKLRKAIDSCFDERAEGEAIRQPNSTNVGSITDALVTLIRNQSKCTVTKQHDGASFRLGQADEDGLLCKVLGLKDEQPSGADIVIRVPWASRPFASASGIELTLCGGTVLAFLIGAGHLKGPVETLRAWPAGAKSVQDLLELVSLHLDLREPLLQLNEPGIA